jgi:hypothetical protein
LDERSAAFDHNLKNRKYSEMVNSVIHERYRESF